ncbi:MAG TPA: glycoside hydrolase family 31 protein [Verrucomicrobiae bacterium]|nr:glycoside hydrolase family 31 protein [Verrucomicrobiae bacterium]
MKRTIPLYCGFVLLVLPAIGVADPGNLVSWSSNNLNELTFTCQSTVVKLDMLDTSVVRVRMTSNDVPFSTNASFTVVRSWPRPAMSVTDGNTLIVSNAGLRVEINKTPFRLSFRKPDGSVVLANADASVTTNSADGWSADFAMIPGEQFYGLGLVLGKPLSYFAQLRRLYNARTGFHSGAMTDMAVPLVVSSHGYGLFVDNTFRQDWDFNRADGTQWQAQVSGGEMNYYFIRGDSPAEVLDHYTQMTGRAPLPPRWALGYIQSKYGFHNWAQMFSAKDSFRTNDLPCDALVLDLYWFGASSKQMGALQWDTNKFPNPAANIASLGKDGFKVITIHEPYFNSENEPAKSNFLDASARKVLMTTNYPDCTMPSVLNGFFGNGGYLDYNNPAARGWLFEKLRPIIDEGVAGHWTDLGEPEKDDVTDFSYDGRRELELHNVQNLLWHQGLAEGYATNYPNQRLYIISRSGFAGDQRYGAAHWSNDVGADWPTLAAHPNALCDYSLSGLSYFGSDIGGFTGIPTDELYARWFEFGAFCPVFRAHGKVKEGKPITPYEFGDTVRDICRTMLKLRYRLLPYVYTAARETTDTGLPMCRPLPLAYPGDTNGQNDGSEFLFGPNILVAPVTAEGATARSVYLPRGNWIDFWRGQVLAGSVTTNWPAPLTQIPLFFRENSITPLGPDVASSQFDDGSERGLRIYCSSVADNNLYDDDGASNGYRKNEFAITRLHATSSRTNVFINIGSAVGTYTGQPKQRAWNVELFCTNRITGVTADGANLKKLTNKTALAAAKSGYFLDGSEKLLRIKLPPAAITRPHKLSVHLAN